jgi:putative oxidoreductase
MLRFLSTDDSTTRLFQRLVLGAVMPHGAQQKLFGLFGGYGFTGTMGFLHRHARHAGAGGLVGHRRRVDRRAGAHRRPGHALTAFGVAAVMVGAVWFAHLPQVSS